MPYGDFHLDRVRAESFGAAAETYQRVRPGPPAALIDDLAALRPRRVLDVGCGTGKIGGALAARGADVLGVEIDARMAALAPFPVEVAPFEAWDDAGRRFDLVVSADAWHWIDPERGEAKLARLAPGAFVRIWNYHELEPELLAEVDAVHARLAPHIRPPGHAFSPAWQTDGEERVYHWDATLTAADWLALVGTYSGHATLANRAQLDDALRAVLPEQVTARFGVVSHWRRVRPPS